MEISRAFSTVSESVSYFFRRQGIGYYIPLYQREYSWDEENIEQLMDDICSGVKDLLDAVDTLHFMGTIILVTENDTENNIKPQDPRSLPSRIDNVIDGQQRLSTITLLACCLYQRIYEITKKLPEQDEFEGLKEASETYLNILLDVFSFNLMRGKPQRKPIIIRGSIDGWTLNGEDNQHYKSDVSSYIASFIRTIEKKTTFPDAKKNSLVADNLKEMKSWLDKVENAHKPGSEDFPPAKEILEKVNQADLWSYQRPELVDLVHLHEEKVCSLVQLFAFCYFLLERCCLTLIQPVSQVRAFDMFQSLNATGSPLTSLETFKPLVVNDADAKGNGFQDSNFEDYFTLVEKLTSSLRSASSKTKRTNEYLNLFALAYDGKKLSKQFSAQRKWLVDVYTEYQDINDREEFIRQMGDTAVYCSKFIYFPKKENLPNTLLEIGEVPEPHRREAILCILYLQDATHRMANTVLSRFYSLILRYEANADKEFASACKAVAAFFTLWRSALTNTGLDDIYRSLLREKISWKKGNSELNIEVLKKVFIEELKKKGIGTKDDWKKKAIHYLKYNNAKQVCRFALFVAAHDTIQDSTEPGLMKIARAGSYPYLEPSKWLADDFKSIEHVAPQKPEANTDWDAALYENNDSEQIGNLLLLPTEINSSVSNKGWVEKWIYYQHLAETDLDKSSALSQQAEKHGVKLNTNTIKLLQNTSYKHHIESIVQLGIAGKWDKAFVEKRTERICDILWERMNEWLS